LDDPLNYVGIDPGFLGGIAVIDEFGVPQVWPLPITDKGGRRGKEYDLGALNVRFRVIKSMYPSHDIGLEWGTSRPGEVPESARRYGVGMGQLEGLMWAHRLNHERVNPVTWKKKLGLKGKTKKGWEGQSAAMFKLFYPDHMDLITGPRGGLKDGLCDALLIAHYMRMQTLAGLTSIKETCDDTARQALLLGFGRTKFKGFS